MNYNVYLAGCMTYHLKDGKENYLDKAVAWREDITNRLTEITFGKGNAWFEDVFDPTVNFLENLENEVTDASVVRQNTLYLDRADIIVVNLEDADKSMGTVYEICYGGIMNKTVLAFGDNQITSVPHIRHSITEQFETLDELITHITNMYHA